MPKPSVNSRTISPSHHFSLSDGETEIGFKLANGARSMNQVAQTPDTLYISGGASKFGDWEPSVAHIGQDTWIGGRGNDNFSLDNTRFFDSYMCFSFVDGRITSAPQWRFGEGHKRAENAMMGGTLAGGHNVIWTSLQSNYYANQFTSSSSTYDMERIQLWIRRIGSPQNDLTVELRSDSSGPNTVLKTATVTASDVDSILSEFVELTITAQTQASTTTYWVVVYDNGGGTDSNHWEIATGTGATAQAMTSTDGSSWSNSDIQIYFRVTEAPANVSAKFFEFRESLYRITNPADGTAAKLEINGDRGEATSATSTTIVDSDQSWTADEHIGSWVKIIANTGEGQYRQITDNDGTSLTVAAWDTNPDSTSLYVIYSSDKWTDISPSSGDQFDSPVLDVLVANDIVYFARGNGSNMIRMRWNEGASPPAHEFADETGDNADVLFAFTDTTNDYQIFVGENATKTVTRYDAEAWGTALGTSTAGTSFDVGDDSANIVNMTVYNGKLTVFKEDGVYTVTGDKAIEEDTGLSFIKSRNTGEAVQLKNFFLYFSWGEFELMQFQKNSSIIDMAGVGPNRGEGLPSNRRGRVSALGFHPAGLLVAVDAEDGYSSILVRTDPVGYHEIFRAPLAGKSIKDIYWQSNDGTFPRLWMQVGDEVIYQEWPRKTFNFLKDDGINYQHESYFIMSDIDMGAPRLYKYLSELSLISENLTTGIQVGFDFQVDDKIDTDNWISVESFFESPSEELEINEGEIKKVRIRLRLNTDTALIPPVIRGVVLEGFARTPLKYQFTARVKVSDYQYLATTGAKDHEPEDVIAFLKDAATKAKRMRLRSQWKEMDDIWVIVSPPAIYPKFSTAITSDRGDEVEFVMREA